MHERFGREGPPYGPFGRHGGPGWIGMQYGEYGEHGGPGGPPPFRGRGGRKVRMAGGEPFGAFFGRGPRAARGDIRNGIICLLGEEPMHGYQIIGELRERSGGVWKASPGSVYPTLQLLEDEGLIKGEEADGKRVFQLTDAGREVLASRPAGAPTPWDEVGAGADASVFGLKPGFMQLGGALRQLAETGSASQVAAAMTVLTDARRAIYRILAEDPAEQSGGPGASPSTPE